MLNKLLLFLFLSMTILVNAHQPDVSTTMLVEKENNTWILQISASLTAFQQEVKTYFEEYNTPEEFQEMVLEHIKKNLEITFNDNQSITLSHGIVKLGHESKVVFEVFGVPSEIKSVFVKNSTFKNVYNNQSALVILKNGFDKEHFVLNNKNSHSLHLKAEQNRFILKTKNEASIFSFKMLIVLLSILILGVLYKMKTRKNSN